MYLPGAEQQLRGWKKWYLRLQGQGRAPVGGEQDVSEPGRAVYYNPENELGPA
jgi:hypothetical protein